MDKQLTKPVLRHTKAYSLVYKYRTANYLLPDLLTSIEIEEVTILKQISETKYLMLEHLNYEYTCTREDFFLTLEEAQAAVVAEWNHNIRDYEEAIVLLQEAISKGKIQNEPN